MNRARNFVLVIFLTLFSGTAIAAAIGYYLVATPAGARALVDYALLRAGQYASVTIESYSGTIAEGLVLKNVEVKNWTFSGPKASARLQRVDIVLPLFDWPNIRVNIFNGRLDLPDCDTALVNGTYSDGALQVTLYSKALDVGTIMRPFLVPEVLKNLKGTVVNANLTLVGTLANPRIRGHFYVDHIQYMDTIVREGLARYDLAFLPDNKGQWRMYGPLILESGLVNVRRSTIELSQSRGVFNGDVDNPALSIHGTGKVDQYTIDLAVTGTLAKPVVKLHTDPYLPEDMAMMALGLGSWMPSYYDVPYNTGGAEKMGVKKKIADDLSVGFALEQSPTLTGQQPEYSRTLEGELSITERVSFNVAERLNPQRSDTQNTSTQGDTRSQNESLLYLKYKNTF